MTPRDRRSTLDDGILSIAESAPRRLEHGGFEAMDLARDSAGAAAAAAAQWPVADAVSRRQVNVANFCRVGRSAWLLAARLQPANSRRRIRRSLRALDARHRQPGLCDPPQ